MSRPSKYKSEYCEQMIDYFSIPHYKESEVITTYKNGSESIKTEKSANPLPLFETFARKIGVVSQTLLNWKEVYSEFLGAYNACKDLQKAMIVENTLLGLYNPAFAIFTAKNITDMKDVVNTDITSGGEKIGMVDPVKAKEFETYMRNRER